MGVLGFDTSNYTTSIAYFNGKSGTNCSKLLPVKEGALGLRQSDAVFHHTQSLPELSGRLFSGLDAGDLRAVGVSTQPRAVEGSYMPCFTVGYSHAKMLSDALGIPLFTFSHQQGHIAASLWSADRLDLMKKPHLAWHLSGGTTELLLVNPDGKNVSCEKIGGTSDISAGQLIDRTGQLLGLPFPAGKHLDALSATCNSNAFFRVKCPELTFSFSGVQNKVNAYFENHTPEETAAYAILSVAQTVLTATKNALRMHPGLPVVFSGGVASNSTLRKVLSPVEPIFCEPQYSTDNAMGIAILTHLAMEE